MIVPVEPEGAGTASRETSPCPKYGPEKFQILTEPKRRLYVNYDDERKPCTGEPTSDKREGTPIE
jgi:hypothetical protein